MRAGVGQRRWSLNGTNAQRRRFPESEEITGSIEPQQRAAQIESSRQSSVDSE
jgi:hypothetical protein